VAWPRGCRLEVKEERGLHKLIESTRDLVVRALHRQSMPRPPDELIQKAELRLTEVAVFAGADFIANTAPDASVELLDDGRHIAVTTPAATWAYAAHLLLDNRSLPTTGDLLLRVDLWVNQGAVNVGVVGPDGQFIAHETRAMGDGRSALNLLLKGEDRPSQIVVRNAGRSVAMAVVERVQVYRRVEDPFAEAALARAPVRASVSSQPLPRAIRFAAFARAKANKNPLVSLILTVKNGLPYLDNALESVRGQSYRNLELVVQDCLSTDGSSERVAKFDGARVHVRREADGGIGDANNRALKRCRGTIIGSIDSDNLLEPDAVARAVTHFAAHPGDAAIYGSVRMISATRTDEGVFRPGPMDFLHLVSCDLVLPWSTAFFNKAICGDALRLDPQLKTCADYDTWLRLSHLPISFIDQVQGATRLSDSSMTCRPENYEQFCKDKIFVLRRYAGTCAHEPLRGALVRHGLVGIYCWAAESIKGLAPERVDLIADFHERAKAVDPVSPRLALAGVRLL
jgi:glycosyltransferase involved in cell wall biosynthesis